MIPDYIKVYIIALLVYIIYSIIFKYGYLSLHKSELIHWIHSPGTPDKCKPIARAVAIFMLFTITMFIWGIVLLIMTVVSL